MALELIIVTPEGQSYNGTVEQVVLPGAEGEFGVLADHERYLAPLKHGPVEIRTADGSRWAAVSDGFADVSGEQVVVLVDHCALAEDLIHAEVELAKQEAEDALAEDPDEEERADVEVALVRASVALEVLQRHHG